MKIYHYHPITGELIGSPTKANPSPEEPGKFLMPADSTDKVPPTPGDNEVVVWIDGGWHVSPDHRGHTYWTEDGARHTITEIGQEPPSGALNEPPPPTLDEQAAQARAKRDGLLKASDWTQIPDTPLTDTKRAEWRDYRTALRDLPQHKDWPDVEFPTQP